MLLNNFKNKIIQKRIKKSLKSNSVNRDISDDKIESIGVLAFANIPNLKELENLLQKEFNCKKINFFLFKSFEKNKETLKNEFTNKDLNWKTSFNNPNLVEFLNETFDLLIGYFDNDNIYLKNAVLLSSAKFKVGFSSIEEYIYELKINTKPDNHKEFITELKKYLIALNKVKI